MTAGEIGAVVTAFVAAPLWQGAVKAWERVQLKRAASEADDHQECREEVRALRGDVSQLRTSIAACETKHATSEAKVNALDTLVQILVQRMDGARPLRDTDPPGAPAE